jgi:environmental stress-induced protein Ves
MKPGLRPIDTGALPAVPWKNGGGATRNLAIEPEGAGFEDFLWRVSIADVGQSGTFSLFPGVDRTIVLLDGDGMMLHAGGGAEFALTAPFAPYTFRGEDSIEARLIGGPTRDFNVMVRRGLASAVVESWQVPAELSRAAGEAVFYCPRGSFRLFPDDDAGVLLLAGGALRVSGATAGTRLVPVTSDAVLIGALIFFEGEDL